MDVQFALSSATAFLEILLFGGIIFGFPSLQYILEKERYFENLCNLNARHEISVTNNASNFTRTTCGEQEANFNLVFTLGSSSLFIATFLWGYLIDRFGTRIFRCIISFFYTLGYFLLTISTEKSAFLLFPASILLGTSGIGVLLSNYQIANLSKTIRGSLITCMNGVFSSAVAVFLVLKKTYDAGLELNLTFKLMTCLTLFLWLRTFLLLPRKSIPFPLPAEGVKYGWKETKCFKASKEKETTSESKRISETGSRISTQRKYKLEQTSPNLNGRVLEAKILKTKSISSHTKVVSFDSFKTSLAKLLYWTNAFHYSVIGLRLSFLFSSVLSWLRSFEDPVDISRLNDAFATVLLFGVFISPLNGIIIDSIKKILKSSTSNDKILNLKASFVSMLITSILSIICSGFALIPSVYGTFVFHLLTRGFVHGGHAAFVATNFPFYHFGKLLGLTGFIAGIVSFAQYGLFQVSNQFDPTFYYINLGFFVACILTLIHPLAIFLQIKQSNNHNISKNYSGKLNFSFTPNS